MKQSELWNGKKSMLALDLWIFDVLSRDDIFTDYKIY